MDRLITKYRLIPSNLNTKRNVLITKRPKLSINHGRVQLYSIVITKRNTLTFCSSVDSSNFEFSREVSKHAVKAILL